MTVNLRIRNYRELGSGAIYLSFGLAALWFGRDYPLGTGARMGPGYFPVVLGAIMSGFGIVSLVRAVVLADERMPHFAWRPLVLIIGSVVLFGLVLPYVGFAVALAVLILIGASASERFRLEWKPLLGMAVLITLCVVVFVLALGVPLPLYGSLFGG